MTDIPTLTEDQIRGRTTPQSFAKGEAYQQRDAIFDPVIYENRLEGFCEGSEPYPYKVTVEFDEDGITSTTCTCPYDWGGDCKHVVALLLTYLHAPEVFQERPPLIGILAAKSQEELVELILKMVERLPILELLILDPDEFEERTQFGEY